MFHCCLSADLAGLLTKNLFLLGKYLRLISVLVLNSRVVSAKHFGFVFQLEPSLLQRLKRHFLGGESSLAERMT